MWPPSLAGVQWVAADLRCQETPERGKVRQKGVPTPELAPPGKVHPLVPMTTTTSRCYHGDRMGGGLKKLPYLLLKEPEKILECLQSSHYHLPCWANEEPNSIPLPPRSLRIPWADPLAGYTVSFIFHSPSPAQISSPLLLHRPR